MIKRLKWILWDSGKSYHPTEQDTNTFFLGLIFGSIVTSVVWAVLWVFLCE